MNTSVKRANRQCRVKSVTRATGLLNFPPKRGYRVLSACGFFVHFNVNPNQFQRPTEF